MFIFRTTIYFVDLGRLIYQIYVEFIEAESGSGLFDDDDLDGLSGESSGEIDLDDEPDISKRSSENDLNIKRRDVEKDFENQFVKVCFF